MPTNNKLNSEEEELKSPINPEKGNHAYWQRVRKRQNDGH
jgi:hypothetical protein